MACGSLTITFSKNDTGSDNIPKTKNVTLVVRDFITEEVISNASVTVTSSNGYSKTGTSSTTGTLDLGELSAGTYTLVVTATNYKSTTSDYLSNDTFTI